MDAAVATCLECDSKQQFMKLAANVGVLFKQLPTSPDDRAKQLAETARKFKHSQSRLLFYNAILWSHELAAALTYHADPLLYQSLEFQSALAYFKRQTKKTCKTVSVVAWPTTIETLVTSLSWPALTIAATDKPAAKLKAQTEHQLNCCSLIGNAIREYAVKLLVEPQIEPWSVLFTSDGDAFWSSVTKTMAYPRWRLQSPGPIDFNTDSEHLQELVLEVFGEDGLWKQYGSSPRHMMEFEKDDAEMKTSWSFTIPMHLLPPSEQRNETTIVQHLLQRHFGLIESLKTVQHLAPFPNPRLTFQMACAAKEIKVRSLCDDGYFLTGGTVTSNSPKKVTLHGYKDIEKEAIEFCLNQHVFEKRLHDSWHKYEERCREFTIIMRGSVAKPYPTVAHFLKDWDNARLPLSWILPSQAFGLVVIRRRSDRNADLSDWGLHRLSSTRDEDVKFIENIMFEMRDLRLHASWPLEEPFHMAALSGDYPNVSRNFPGHQIKAARDFAITNYEHWVPLQSKVYQRICAFRSEDIDRLCRHSKVDIISQTANEYVCRFNGEFARLLCSPLDPQRYPMQFTWADIIVAKPIMRTPEQQCVVARYFQHDKTIVAYALDGWYPCTTAGQLPYVFNDCYWPRTVCKYARPIAFESKFKEQSYGKVFSRAHCETSLAMRFDQKHENHFSWELLNVWKLQIQLYITSFELHFVRQERKATTSSPPSEVKTIERKEAVRGPWRLFGLVRDSLLVCHLNPHENELSCNVVGDIYHYVAFFLTDSPKPKEVIHNTILTQALQSKQDATHSLKHDQFDNDLFIKVLS